MEEYAGENGNEYDVYRLVVIRLHLVYTKDIYAYLHMSGVCRFVEFRNILDAPQYL